MKRSDVRVFGGSTLSRIAPVLAGCMVVAFGGLLGAAVVRAGVNRGDAFLVCVGVALSVGLGVAGSMVRRGS